MPVRKATMEAEAATPPAWASAGPKEVEPHLFVIFGATGDLMGRKLLPALYHVVDHARLGGRFALLGVARPELNDETFRAKVREILEAAGLTDSRQWDQSCVHFQQLVEDTPDQYEALAARITELERVHDLPGNRIYYLALPPAAFPTVIALLGKSGLSHSPGWARVVIEKPFGRDLSSASELNRVAHRGFKESQIYRIDHYLGKETVQNLLTFRFANPIFESVWNRDRVERVMIAVAETLGVEHRAAYYETAGALRDMVQNHLTQLLTVTAMELPAAFDADAIRYEKAKVLRSVVAIRPKGVILGQYARGQIDGAEVSSYREEPGVSPDSETETFACLKLEIANWRWQGVPFYLLTGKRLRRRVSRIVVTFRRPPISIFQPLHTGRIHPNILIITLQPNEGFDLRFEVKVPGQLIRLEPQTLRFRYAEAFQPLAEAYETLLYDIMIGDQTLFVSADWVEASWRLYTPLLDHGLPRRPYAAGTWGPAGIPNIDGV